MSFGEALSAQLDLVGGIKRAQPYKAGVETKRGFNLRLGYVLSSKTGVSLDRFAELAGVSKRTVRAWQGGRTPSNASRAKVDRVYRDFLEARDHGHLSKKAAKVAAVVAGKKLKIRNQAGDERFYPPGRHWPQLVDLWSRDDPDGMDDVWAGVVSGWDYAGAWEPELIDEADIA